MDPIQMDNPGAWRGALEEGMREDPSAMKFENVGALLTSYNSLQSKLGHDTIIQPSDTSAPEIWDAYFKAGGRPDAADGYTFEMNAVPETLKPYYTDDDMKSYGEVAHQLGISQKQAEGLLKWNVERNGKLLDGQVAGNTQAAVAQEDALKAKWGTEYEGNMQKAQAAFTALVPAGPETEAFVKSFGTNPLVLEAFLSASASMADSQLKLGEGKGGGMSLAEAEAEFKRVMDAPGYRDAYAIDHDALVKRATELAQVLDQQKSTVGMNPL